jgi:hypothetical protein
MFSSARRSPSLPSGVLMSEVVAKLLAAHTRGPAHLTDCGLSFIHQVLSLPPTRPSAQLPPVSHGELPSWDRQHRQLWQGGRKVRSFARLAPKQMAVLDALQAGGWSVDGVPNPFGDSAKGRRRLHNTVNNLMRRVRRRRFRLREDGLRVWWEPTRATTRKYTQERAS